VNGRFILIEEKEKIICWMYKEHAYKT